MAIVRTFVIKVEGDQATIELKAIEKQADKTAAALSSVSGSAGAAAKNQAAHATVLKGKAIPAMNEFSRVIQDAPYGMQGVANNIQQMTVQFGYLSSQAGGAGAALKAMLGSLLGPAGIIFLISAATTAMVAYGDEIWEFITGTEKATDVTIEFNKELEKQKELLDDLRGAFSEGAETAAMEAELAGKSAEEVFEIKKKYLLAEIEANRIVAEEANKRYESAQIAARKTGDLEEEEIEKLNENLANAFNSRLTAEESFRRSKLQLFRAELQEKKRIAEIEGVFSGEAGEALTGATKSEFEIAETDTKVHLDNMAALYEGYRVQQNRISSETANANMAYAEEEAEFRIQALEATGDALLKLSILAGKESEEGKALAAAAVLVSSAVAIINTWRQYTAMTAPGPWATAAAVAQTAVIGAATAASLSQIYNSNNGQQSVGIGGGGSVSAPSYNVVAPTQTTALEQQLAVNGVRIDQDTPVKAYVTSTDMTSMQNLDRQIEANASF